MSAATATQEMTMVADELQAAAGLEPQPGLLGESAETFSALTEPYRRVLLVHCYRMLGSIDDAEDAVQDALIRAWNGRATFRQAISLRAWLYRIATNACLDAIDRRRRAGGLEEHLGVGPFPDDLLDETAAGPETRYDSHESISLAFLTALQLLPPRQRAVLILRDVLRWHASEVAELLELSVPAVNSALHRARTTISAEYRRPDSSAERRPAAAAALRSLLERYVRAWEAADVAGLVALLRDDAVVSMPPGLTVIGRDAIAAFLADSVFVDGLRVRLRALRTNGGPGFGIYSGAAGEDRLQGYAVLVLDPAGPAIGRMSVFAQPGLLSWFGLPPDIAA
ncbi:MAG TPA: RNA polymerase subunit sigma-70 [Candidatus Limnocylindrales bacterium]|nr:RNA polymerase subunit sigma-70 [Candidatus Limnocylindrales bacterium]